MCARFLKNYPPGSTQWFMYHRGLQSVGMVLAVGGFVIALKNFEAPGQVQGGGGAQCELRPWVPRHPRDDPWNYAAN